MMDIDGVLIHSQRTDGQQLFADLETDFGLSPALLNEAFFTPHWEAIVTGKDALASRLAAVLAEIAPQVSADALIAYWFENDARVDEDVLAAMSAYRQRGLPVFLTTNQEHLRARYLMEVVGLGRHVDGIVYSAAVGHRKPYGAFFDAAAAIVKAEPANLVLVDDILANVEGARQRGWRAVHWLNDQPLARALAPYLD